MTPFLQFRIWFRRAHAGQRVSAIGAVAVVLALLVWAAVPSGNPAQSSVAVGGTSSSGAQGLSGGSGAPTATGASGGGSAGSAGSAGAATPSSGAVSGGTGSTGGTPGAVSSGSATGAPGATGSAGGTVPAVASGATGATGGTGSTAPAGSTTQSCTKRGTMKIGVVVPTAAGGSINSVIGNPPTAQEESDYAAVLDSVNKAGGVDCYNLVGDYATADLTNPSSAQSGCLQFVQDKVFAVLGGFEPLFSDDCLLQAHIPTFDQLAIPQGSAQKYYPYYFSDYSTYEVLYKNFVQAVDRMGYFGAGHGFAKLGVFYESCNPEIHQALMADLAAVGVSGSKVSTYNLGCSGAFAPPNVIAQAVLQFKAAGVTTATIDDDIADAQTISDTASAQGWHPAWILPDYGEVAVTGSASEHPNASEFNGAVAITSSQYGAIGSNLPETPGTQQCDQIMKSHGLPTVYQSGDQFAGSACSQVWMLVAGLEHGSLSAAGIVAGLQAVKSVTLSFPLGPNDFSAPGTTTGGQFWRTDTYNGTCQCWKVVNPAWSPSF